MTNIAKDLHRLMRQVGKLTDGQASIYDLDWDDLQIDSFKVEIKPNSGYYKGGSFKFKIEVPYDYENNEPPNVYCETDIYHPNIETADIKYERSGSNVCLNLFDQGTWNHKLGLEGAVMGLVFLLHSPNLEDPMPEFADGVDVEMFQENVKKYMRGEEVYGRRFSADFLKHLQPDVNSNSEASIAQSDVRSTDDQVAGSIPVVADNIIS